MDFSAILTAKESGRSRIPLHSSHGSSLMNCSRSLRFASDSVCAYTLSKFGMTPSKELRYSQVESDVLDSYL